MIRDLATSAGQLKSVANSPDMTDATVCAYTLSSKCGLLSTSCLLWS